jgi:hypothetical protein
VKRFARTLLIVCRLDDRRSSSAWVRYGRRVTSLDHDGRFPVSPHTARTLAMLGACGAVLWVMLSVSGYLHEESRVTQQQAGPPAIVVALPAPAG